MDHDEDPIGVRLRFMLSEQAERDPLRPDFAATLAESLPNRSRWGPRPMWVVAALASTALVAIATFATVAFLLDRQIGTSSASPNASTHHESASPSSVPTLRHYADEELGFDYPSDWRIIEQHISARHYQWIPVVLGTGDWTLNCQPMPPTSLIAGGITCGADIFTVPPGGVVVEFSTWQVPPWVAAQTPPPWATELPAGLPSTDGEVGRASTWRIYIPGWTQPLIVEARYHEPDVELRREQVRAMVESLVFLGLPSP